MFLHVITAVAPAASNAGQWVWDKGNTAVSRVSLVVAKQFTCSVLFILLWNWSYLYLQ